MRSAWRKRRRAGTRRAFTLLEVMMAVAFLGLSLTAIFAAQAGAVKNVSYAKNVSVTTGLLRCKMSELEEHLMRDGFQEMDESDSGKPCCEGDDASKYICAWRIEKPVLPDGKFGDLDLSSALNLGGSGSPLSGGSGGLSLGQGSNPGDVAKSLSGLVTPPAGGSGSDPGAAMGALAGGLGPGAVGAIAQMAMSMIYPSLKLVFEASTRRITVIATWREGDREYGIDLAQWVTSPQKAGVSATDPNSPDGGL